jgi:alkylation response protein AidB-like acyl-CoA dehydrogenase
MAMETTPSSLDAETKSLIEAALNRFVDDVYEPNARRQRLNRRDVDYRAHWGALAELGVLGLPVIEAFGGIGGNTQDVADALCVLARGLVLEPLIEAAVIATAVLRAAPEPETALAAAASGAVLAILVGGRRGDDLRCQPLGSGYLLSGIARVVPGAGQADAWLVAGADEAGQTRVLRVAPRDVEAQVKTYRLMDGREAADIEFPACTVPAAALWLEGEAAQAALDAAAAQAVSAYAADAVGVMQSLVTMTADYLRTREQFGATLATFQALQHRFADMHIAARESRAIARALAHAIDAGDLAQTRWLRFAVPSVLSRCGERVGHEAIQMHGGMGVTDELIVSHCNARLVVLNQLLARWSALPAPH